MLILPVLVVPLPGNEAERIQAELGFRVDFHFDGDFVEGRRVTAVDRAGGAVRTDESADKLTERVDMEDLALNSRVVEQDFPRSDEVDTFDLQFSRQAPGNRQRRRFLNGGRVGAGISDEDRRHGNEQSQVQESFHHSSG